MDKGFEKFMKDSRFAGKFIMKDMLPVKMSTVILDFAKPLLDKIDLSNKKVTEKTIHQAIEIWNNIIVVDRACVEAGEAGNRIYRLAMLGASKQNLSFNISQSKYNALCKRKEELYPDNNYFIIDHNLRWSDNGEQMHLAVVTNDASNIKLKS